MILEVELTESDRKTILFGYEIGHAKLDDGRDLRIVGSGRTLRFTVSNRETGNCIVEYDLDLTPIAKAVFDSR